MSEVSPPHAAIDAGASGPDTAAEPWVRLYGPGIPPSLVADHGDMLSLFRDAVRRNPDGPALIYFDQVTTFAALDAQSDALAAWLQDRGIAPGDRVGVVAQNLPAFPLLCLAAWKAGAAPVPGNPMYRSAELARIFADAAPRAVLCQEAEAEETFAALAAAGLADLPIIVASPSEGQSRNDGRILPPRTATSRGERLTDILDGHRGRRPRPASFRPEDLALILYTSGTTGQPKGAMLLHSGMAFNAQVIRQWCGLDQDDRILAIAPLFHVTGLVCHMCAAFSAACPMILSYRFEPSVVLEMIRTHKPSFTIGAITAFNALLRLPDVTAADMASLKKVWSGGAPIPPALRDRIEKQLGLSVHNSYGMTELTSPAVLAPYGHEAPVRDDVLSIGIPIPSTEVRIADEQGEAVTPGSVGEILVRGPQVMAGYWRKSEESAAALAGGWMHSGDIGFMDEQGWLYLVDRKKDVIIASGFKVWPREVEDVLYTHPAVREAAVIGVPDPYRGETVKACLSLIDGASVREDELIAYCRERLAAYKAPRVVAIMDDLPKTVSGKIQRVALRDAEAGR